MSRRLAKEFRLLLVPWLIAAIAAAALPFQDYASALWPYGALAEFLVNLVPFVFTITLAVTAALSFGTEFQHGTLANLLAQPLSRSRIWAEKSGTIAASIMGVGLIYCVTGFCVHRAALHWPRVSAAMVSASGSSTILFLLFLLATVCSAVFWSLTAGSTIGGAVFTLSAEFLTVLILRAGYNHFAGPAPEEADTFSQGPLLLVAAVVYSGVFLWLGWHRFVRLELRQVIAGSGAETPGVPILDKIRRPAWLQCQTRGPLRNLFRKEVRLQKPTFLLAMLYCLCWFATVGMMMIEPMRTELFQNVLGGLTALYIPLILIVVGCISLGEENGLGVREWHLTLPISTTRQWWVKMGVTLAMGASLALLIPGGLALLTAGPAQINLSAAARSPQDLSALVCAGLACLVASFWASTMVGNTVRAALTAMVVLVLAGGCMALGAWGALINGGLETGLLNQIRIHWHLPPYFLAESITIPVALCAFGLVLLVALVQSCGQFHRAQPDSRALRVNGLVLAGVILVASFWAFDLLESQEMQRRLSKRMLDQVQQALMGLPAPKPGPPPGYVRPVTWQELANTTRLSPETAEWLNKASIYMRVMGNMNEVTIDFVGHGRSVVLSFQRGVRGGR